MQNDRTVTCPHCLNNVPWGARVCRGCNAEITYGPPLIAQAIALLIPTIIAWSVIQFVDKYLISNDTLLAVVFLAIFIPIVIKTMKYCKNRYKDNTYFKRLYRN